MSNELIKLEGYPYLSEAVNQTVEIVKNKKSEFTSIFRYEKNGQQIQYSFHIMNIRDKIVVTMDNITISLSKENDTFLISEMKYMNYILNIVPEILPSPSIDVNAQISSEGKEKKDIIPLHEVAATDKIIPDFEVPDKVNIVPKTVENHDIIILALDTVEVDNLINMHESDIKSSMRVCCELPNEIANQTEEFSKIFYFMQTYMLKLEEEKTVKFLNYSNILEAIRNCIVLDGIYKTKNITILC